MSENPGLEYPYYDLSNDPFRQPDSEIKRPYWQLCAQDLFIHEFPTEDKNQIPEAFYAVYDSPVALYNELAKRVVGLASHGNVNDSGAEAYVLMNEAYLSDAHTNEHTALHALIFTYHLLSTE